MLVRYRFVNEMVEVEVSEEWGKALVEQDRLEYNNEQKETRRHVSLEALPYEGKAFESGINQAEFMIRRERISAIQAAFASLSEEQRALLVAVFVEGQTLEAIGRAEGVTRSAISHRLATAVGKMKKFLRSSSAVSPTRPCTTGCCWISTSRCSRMRRTARLI